MIWQHVVEYTLGLITEALSVIMIPPEVKPDLNKYHITLQQYWPD